MENKKWIVNGKEFEENECIQYVDKNGALQDGYLRKVHEDKDRVDIFGYAPSLEEGQCIITTKNRLFKIA